MTPIIATKYRFDLFYLQPGGELVVQGNRKAARPVKIDLGSTQQESEQ